MNRRAAELGGRRAERVAAWWLRLKGWHILAIRARTPVGEVDLVARRRHILAFVEVKARATRAEAAIALDDYRLRRVARAAQALLPRYGRDGDVMRFDAVYIVPWRLPDHRVDIFRD
jgi:putative endonuclease